MGGAEAEIRIGLGGDGRVGVKRAGRRWGSNERGKGQGGGEGAGRCFESESGNNAGALVRRWVGRTSASARAMLAFCSSICSLTLRREAGLSSRCACAVRDRLARVATTDGAMDRGGGWPQGGPQGGGGWEWTQHSTAQSDEGIAGGERRTSLPASACASMRRAAHGVQCLHHSLRRGTF